MIEIGDRLEGKLNLTHYRSHAPKPRVEKARAFRVPLQDFASPSILFEVTVCPQR